MYGEYLSVKLYTSSKKPLLGYGKLSAQDMLWVNTNPGGLSTRLVVHYKSSAAQEQHIN